MRLVVGRFFSAIPHPHLLDDHHPGISICQLFGWLSGHGLGTISLVSVCHDFWPIVHRGDALPPQLAAPGRAAHQCLRLAMRWIGLVCFLVLPRHFFSTCIPILAWLVYFLFWANLGSSPSPTRHANQPAKFASFRFGFMQQIFEKKDSGN